MKKIIILNVGWSNKGNVALVRSTMDNIKESMPDVEFELIGLEDDIKNYNLPFKKPLSMGLSLKNPRTTFQSFFILLQCFLFQISKKIHLNRTMSTNSVLYDYYNFDIIINSGGDSLSGEIGLGSSAVLFNLLYSILLDKPTVLFSESLGYFKSRWMNLIMKFVLNRTTLILVRDELSLKYLKNSGINKPKIFLTADSAFNLKKSPDSRVKKILENEDIDIDKHFIVMNFSGLISKYFSGKNGSDVYETIAKSVDHLIELNEFEIILLPHVYTLGSDDRVVINRIYDKIKNKSFVRVINGEYAPEELKGIISHSELFVGMRMHTMIAATSLCVPTVAIAYSHKTDGIIGKMLSQEEYVLDGTELEYDKLINVLDSAWNNREKIRQDLEKKIPKVKEKALLNGKLLKKFYLNSLLILIISIVKNNLVH